MSTDPNIRRVVDENKQLKAQLSTLTDTCERYRRKYYALEAELTVSRATMGRMIVHATSGPKIKQRGDI